MSCITCKLSRDILRTTSCGYSLPEITDIYLANFVDVSTSASCDSGGCEMIADITIAENEKFFHIEPAKNSTNFSDELVVEDNGNRYRSQTLTFNISGQYDSCLHKDLDDLSLGRYIAVVQTADGNYLALGRLTGLEASAATLSGGGDQNGLSITLAANTAESAMPLSQTAVDKVKGNE